MQTLIIFNRQPYDGSDVAWNGLRLAENLHKRGETVRIFLMNARPAVASTKTSPISPPRSKGR